MHNYFIKSNRWYTRRFVVCSLILAAGTLLFTPGARAGLPVQSDPRLEAQVDSLVRAAVKLVYAGRLDLGLKTVDLAESIAADDPRIGLTRYRLLRENYPVSVYQEERAREMAPALLDALGETVAFCDSVLQVDDTDPVGYLYRGWAHINRAQTHLIAGHLRAAAGASRQGKNDFDRFYEYHPEGDPDAATVLGSYLFFADTLPGFFKFIRWLIRVPGGDRVRGIALIRRAAAGDGYTSEDAKMILGVVYYLFDGNLEQAGPILTEALDRHPDYPWLVEYTTSMSLVKPAMAPSSEATVARVLDGWGTTTRGWDDAVECRMKWRRARLLEQLGERERSLEEMRKIVDEKPSRAPWLLPVVRTAAMETAGLLGRPGDVGRWCEQVPEKHMGLHDNSNIRRGDDEPECPPVADPRGVEQFVGLGRVRSALYTGRVKEARELLDDIVAEYGESLESRFLDGEIARITGPQVSAIAIFESLQEDADRQYRSSKVGFTWVRDLRVQALIRLGEIYIERGEIEKAKKSYERAEDAEPEVTLYANMIRGRVRYVERVLDAR